MAYIPVLTEGEASETNSGENINKPSNRFCNSGAIYDTAIEIGINCLFSASAIFSYFTGAAICDKDSNQTSPLGVMALLVAASTCLITGIVANAVHQNSKIDKALMRQKLTFFPASPSEPASSQPDIENVNESKQP